MDYPNYNLSLFHFHKCQVLHHQDLKQIQFVHQVNQLLMLVKLQLSILLLMLLVVT